MVLFVDKEVGSEGVNLDVFFVFLSYFYSKLVGKVIDSCFGSVVVYDLG